MSIASEIERLRTAKQNIKSAINKRGVPVSDTAALDEYSGLVDVIPRVFKGTFTPEEDTDTFQLNELDFFPVTISVACKELENSSVESSVVFAYAFREFASTACFVTPSMERKFVFIRSTSEVVTWSDNSVLIKIPSAEQNGFYKKGYTYECVVTGGFPQ